MNDCISHAGLYDDDDNPLADDGSLYLPGVRLCGHRDCVNPRHLEGSGFEPLTYTRLRFDRRKAHLLHAEVVAIGLHKVKPKGSKCLVNGCSYPVSARALCKNHLMMFYRLSPESINHPENLTLDDFANIPPATERTKRSKATRGSMLCSMNNCQEVNICRGLCKKHYQQYWRIRAERKK